MPEDLKKYPLATFLSPCYNHEKYVIQSLESIKNQTYPNIQHIIIDDASTDNSIDVIDKWIEKNNYKCIFIKHSTNKGIGYSLNESIDIAEGEFWTCCATDDCVHPLRTQKFIESLLHNPEFGMVVSDMQMIDENGKTFFFNETSSFLKNRTANHPNFNSTNFGDYQTLLFDNYIPGSLMIKKEVFNSVGKFNEILKIEDWDMWLRISAKYKIGFLDEMLGYYRKHGQNSMITHSPPSLREAMFQTFFNQKQFCYSTNKRELFNKAYIHHFNIYYNPIKHFSTSIIFHHVNFFIYLKAVVNKLGNKLKTSIKTKVLHG